MFLLSLHLCKLVFIIPGGLVSYIVIWINARYMSSEELVGRMKKKKKSMLFWIFVAGI